MGSGMPDLGGGLAGLGQQFADTLSGLLGGSGSDLPDLPEPELDLEDPDLDEDLDEDEDPDEDENPDDEPESPEGELEEAADTEVAGEPLVAVEPEAAVVAGVEDPCEPVAAPAATPAPPPAEPLPPAAPLSAQTPCEIAAGEVPQVGEPAE